MSEVLSVRRRVLGEHLTSKAVFREYILPQIRQVLRDHTWIDLYAGEGNLILPILEEIPRSERAGFFKEHIMLFDIQPEMVRRAVDNAVELGIPPEIARQNISVRDTITSFPDQVMSVRFPAYHITNPPYLYLGYIRKHEETKQLEDYFRGPNKRLQDVYQVCMMNDLRHGMEKLVYIIPSNFLFGYSVSNAFRDDFLPKYKMVRAVIFEKKIFEHTGTNVVIAFFERKPLRSGEPQTFTAIKMNSESTEKTYTLLRRDHYRAGDQFEGFVARNRTHNPVRVEYYLLLKEIMNNPGQVDVKLLDSNRFDGRTYKVREFSVSPTLAKKIRGNLLWVRTVDTGSREGRAGLYLLRDTLRVDGILVSAAPYRTNPIQVFFNPQLSEADQLLLMRYTNTMLEHLRQLTDSEFMTTYKYSESEYTRKYLGLSQVRRLIETFPTREMTDLDKKELDHYTKHKDVPSIISLIERLRNPKGTIDMPTIGSD